MPEQNSKSLSYEAYILLNFTKELIRNTQTYQDLLIKKEVKSLVAKKETEEKSLQEFKKIETQEAGEVKKEIVTGLEEQKKEIKKRVRQKEAIDFKRVAQLKKRTIETPTKPKPNPFASFFAQRSKPMRALPSVPAIPEPRLPPTVQHLRPIPIPTQREIDLKKIMPLVKDPFVNIIECNGPGENLVVIGTMGRKKTGIILTKEEIDEIINAFSEATKIPVSEGVLKVVFGKLVLSAIVSEILGSKFIVRKMNSPFSQ